MDLYACVRPAKSYPGVRSLYKDIDLVVVRENSEDLYAGIEFEEGLPQTKELIGQIEKHTKGNPAGFRGIDKTHFQIRLGKDR